MIRNRTVFILGAGASAPFGFPLGRGLLLSVVNVLQNKEIRIKGSFFALLGECGFSDNKMEMFARELELSMQPSIDAFLENRPEFLDVGKAAIAASLIPYESEGNLHRPVREPHWYEYLFNQLGSTRTDYEQSKLSIITFNYDRSFEHFLFLALKASFGLSDDECEPLLHLVPIVHVYGQLGALDYISTGGRPYRPELTPDTILKCAKEIKIVREGLPDDHQFKQAHDWLSKAEVVCFLGFGYYRSNVERLHLDLIPRTSRVYGCVYGKTRIETLSIQQMIEKFDIKFGQPEFGDGGEDLLVFLRNHPVFLW